MKRLIVLIFALFSQAGLGQDPPVSVLKQKWYEWNDNPLLRGASIFSPAPNPSHRSGGSKKYFVYEAVIKNETDKKIIGLVWDYVTYAPLGETEESRQTFIFTDTVKKRKKKTLSARKLSPPGRAINAKDYEENNLKPIQKVEIKCLLFEDKTTWKPTGTDDAACERLRLSMRRKGRSIPNSELRKTN